MTILIYEDTENRRSVVNNYEKLRIAMRYWLLGKGYQKAAAAMDYAAQRHTGSRKDGSPEFGHQIQITHYLRTIHDSLLYPEITIAVAFLHDTVEDYDVSKADISALFGSEIADPVERVTKLDSFGNKKDPERLFEGMSDCPVSSIVKGADRMHNFSTMHGAFTLAKQAEYIAEAEKFIIPMLKDARRKFHSQEAAYENIKFVLNGQINMTRNALSASNFQG